jgi:hypothetical protein
MRIGDRIKVTNKGRQYSSWGDLAKELGAINWNANKAVGDDMEGHIVGIKCDIKGTASSDIALIRMDSGTEHLIGTGGIAVLYEIGQKVIVKGPGATYDLFESKAKELKVKNWAQGRSLKIDSLVTVVNYDNKRTYLIRDDKGLEYIIGVEGLESLEYDLYEIDEAWEGLLNGL